MQLIYDVVEEDVYQLELVVLQNNKPLQQLVLRKQIAASVIPAIVVSVLFWAGDARITPISIIIPLALGIGLFLFHRLGHKKRIRQAVAQQAKSGVLKGVLGVQHLTLTPDAIISKGPMGEGSIKWTAVQGITETTGPIFLHLIDGKSLIAPACAFDTPEKKREFFHLAERYFKTAHGETVPAASR